MIEFSTDVFDQIQHQGARNFAKDFTRAVRWQYDQGNLTQSIQGGKLNSLVRTLTNGQQWEQQDLDQLDIPAADRQVLEYTVLQVVGLADNVEDTVTEEATTAGVGVNGSSVAADQGTPDNAGQPQPQQEVLPHVEFNDFRGTKLGTSTYPLTIRFEDDRAVLQWDTPATGEWVYRIIVTDDFNDEPEPGRMGEEVGVAFGDYFSWEIHSLTFQNKVAIWRYPYQGEAVIDTPGELHAMLSFTSGVNGLQGTPSSGQINLSWDALESIYESEDEHDYTLVYRFDSPRQAKRALNQATHLFVPHNAERRVAKTRQSAFEDRNIRQGHRYTYVLINVAHDFDPAQGLVEKFSEPASYEIMLEMREEPATLDIEEYQKIGTDGELYDYCQVQYRKVPGQTMILQTTEKPDVNLASFGQQGQTVSKDELAAGKLPLDAAVSFSQVEDDELVTIASVGWPHGAIEMFLTPVTAVNDGYIVGQSREVRRVEPLQQLRVQQRLTWQLVTFNWPDGADKVNIYHLPVDGEWTPEHKPIKIVGKEEYKKESGVRLRGMDITRAMQIVVCGVATGQSGEIRGTHQSAQLEAIYPFSYSIAPYQDDSLGQRALSRFKNMFSKKSWYEVRIKYNGQEPIQNQKVLDASFHIAVADDAAPLTPIENAYMNYRLIPVTTSLDKDQGDEIQTFKLPQVAPNALSEIVGYIEVGDDGVLGPEDLTRVRIMPHPNWRSQLPWPVSLRRRAAHLLDQR